MEIVDIKTFTGGGGVISYNSSHRYYMRSPSKYTYIERDLNTFVRVFWYLQFKNKRTGDFILLLFISRKYTVSIKHTMYNKTAWLTSILLLPNLSTKLVIKTCIFLSNHRTENILAHEADSKGVPDGRGGGGYWDHSYLLKICLK